MKRLAFDYDYDPDLIDADSYDLFVTDPDGTAHQAWTDARAAGVEFLFHIGWVKVKPLFFLGVPTEPQDLDTWQIR